MKMKTAEKIFITAGLVIILCISGGVYLDNKVDKVLEKSSSLGAFLTELNSAEKSSTMPNADNSTNTDQEDQSGGKNSLSTESPPSSASDLVFDDSIEAIIQTKLDKPIERKDKIKVALILIRRLSVDEITYFYDLITLGNYTSEDIRRARAILSDNLNEEEMETLRSLAKKYDFTP